MISRRRATASPAPLVLVVEGDLDTREMYAEWLVYSGLRVVEATQTQEAIKKARRLRPNLITTDIEIEDGRGLDFCTKLKESKRSELPSPEGEGLWVD